MLAKRWQVRLGCTCMRCGAEVSGITAYRLYTVVPRLLDLVEELTNWYVRFNRRRLKAESGPEDAVVALTCLFEALLTLCRTLVGHSRHGCTLVAD